MAGSSDTQTTQTSGSKAKDERVVKYVGFADERKISAADWKTVGADGQEQVVWSAKNDFTVPASDLTPEALAYFEQDSGFKIVEPEKA